ncbi:MAG: methyltransferase domain-containing protein [Candidatus Riflebacteria bacterium]|nr:methyltransferase domain-containing protein [Candidatus Riflebacteria bacterium]
MSLTTKLVLKAIETGIVPERATRAWIRYLCRQATERGALGDVEARHAVFRQLHKELKMGAALRLPISEEPANIELEEDFFRLFFGKRLNSGCCYFPTGAEDLDEAEDTMLWMSADRARTRDGMNILEIGCGWGAMTLWLARQYPQAHITAVIDSTKRSIHLQKQINELDIKNVKIVAAEFEDLDYHEEFDRIICLERFDLLSATPDWEARLEKWLKPGGKFFLQQQVHASLGYYQDSVGLADFPGNSVVNQRLVMPAELLMLFQSRLHIEDYWKVSGEQYRMTAESWLARYYDNRLEILPLLEKVYGKKMAWTWYQRWRLFLIATAVQAGFNRGQDWIVAQYLFSRR